LFSSRFGRPPQHADELNQFRETLGLNDPFPVRYLNWLTKAVQGDLGTSYRSGRPVVEDFLQHLPVTLRLSIGGMIISIVLAFPVGILAAVKHNSILDLLTRLISMLGASMPAFWLSYILIIIFSVRLHWLPVAGTGTWKHMVLPSAAVSAFGVASVSRLLRSSMLEVLGTDYIRAARAKGAHENQVILRHALRNALIPVVTLLGSLFGFLVAGAVIVETIFALPGIGRLIINAIQFRDYPIIQGFVLFTGSIFVLVNLLVDISYTWIDPRVRLTGRGGAGG
jgi:peptide/nickel transport system permease protein